MEREARGLPVLWPRDLGFTGKESSTDYFRRLLADEAGVITEDAERRLVADLGYWSFIGPGSRCDFHRGDAVPGLDRLQFPHEVRAREATVILYGAQSHARTAAYRDDHFFAATGALNQRAESRLAFA